MFNYNALGCSQDHQIELQSVLETTKLHKFCKAIA